MVQQVVNQSQQDPGDQGQNQHGVHAPAAGQAQPRTSPQTSYPSSTTASTVRRISTTPMGIPALSSSACSVRMVSARLEAGGDLVILDSGSDVSLLPLSYGQCGEKCPKS